MFREDNRFNLQEMLQWDSLDLVDKMIEVLGKNSFRLGVTLYNIYICTYHIKSDCMSH